MHKKEMILMRKNLKQLAIIMMDKDKSFFYHAGTDAFNEDYIKFDENKIYCINENEFMHEYIYNNELKSQFFNLEEIIEYMLEE